MEYAVDNLGLESERMEKERGIEAESERQSDRERERTREIAMCVFGVVEHVENTSG